MNISKWQNTEWTYLIMPKTYDEQIEPTGTEFAGTWTVLYFIQYARKRSAREVCISILGWDHACTGRIETTQTTLP
jgi:hypothetical protein